MNLRGTTPVYAVVGHPIAHSRSPEIHNALFARHGLDGVYVALPVDPTEAGRLGAALRTLGLAGVNLTVPFKEAIVPQLDAVEGVAAAVGAVNTVVREGARLVGANTDVGGFLAALRQEHGEVAAGARAVVLGVGGAGRAVAAALLLGGADEVWLVNRTAARAEAAAAALAGRGRLVAAGLDRLGEALRGARVVVQCAAGAGAALPAEGLDHTAPDAVICDINYWNTGAPWLREAAGRRTCDGLGMLGWQAALAFERFTGVAVDGAAVVAALRGAPVASPLVR